MAKTSVDLPQELLAQAKAILGTVGVRDTLVRSLEQVLTDDARRQHFDRLRAMTGLELNDADVRDDAWR